MITFVFLFFWFLWLASPIQANEILLQDDFSRHHLGDWTVVRNSQYEHPEQPCFNQGLPAQWSINAGKLGIDIDGIACSTEIVPSNLVLTPTDNYEFEFEWSFATSTHMDRNLLLKWQDKDNWYGLHILDNKLLLQKVIDGKTASLYHNWGYYDFVADQNYHFKIRVADNTMTIWVNDEQVIQTLDRSPFLTNSFTLGFQASSGDIWQSSSWFDDLIVTSLNQSGGKKLNVPLYKQDDLKWKNHEYDHAQQWSNTPTIARWGCALTSMTMILDYYHINLLPTKQQLNPATLNAWLKTQADGYVGEGLINWLAVTRLTKTMSEQLDTPTLEYQRLKGEIKSAVVDLDQDQPVILQIPGHFLVSYGYNSSASDLLIKDPAYNYTSFSQHQTDLLSVRSFKPSHTDLSYILIVHDPKTAVTLIDEGNHIPSQLQISTEFIQGYLETTPTQTVTKIIQSLAKPENGDYSLKITSDDETTVEIYTYDINGEVTVLSQDVIGTKLFTLDYDSQTKSKLVEITNRFTLLKELLKTLYETQEITTKYAYLKLDQLATYAEQDHLNQDRYSNLIIQTVDELNEFINHEDVIIEFLRSYSSAG